MAWTPNDPDAFYEDAFVKKLPILELAQIYSTSYDRVMKYKGRVAHGVSVERQEEQGGQEDQGQESSDRYNADTNLRTITMKRTPVHTLPELLEFFKIDTDVWEVAQFEVKAWEMGYKNAEKEAAYLPLYGIHAKFRRRVDVETTKQVIERLFKEAGEHAPNYKPFARHATPTSKGRLLELSVVDHHFGKLAWAPEAGESYDLDIASDLFMEAIEHLVAKALATGPVDKVILPLGNDLLQMDGPENLTTGGTAVDVDGRYAKVYLTTCTLMVAVIERLLAIADVDVVMVSGNHDRLTTFHLGEFLKAWFRSSKQVSIDNAPFPRKYVQWGQNMFLYTHGSEEKISELPLIMAQERKAMWGQTSYRFVKLGHFHKKKVMTRIDVDENHGVQTEILPSLCAADEWHAMRGYTGNMRRSEAKIYHAEDGFDSSFCYYASAKV